MRSGLTGRARPVGLVLFRRAGLFGTAAAGVAAQSDPAAAVEHYGEQGEYYDKPCGKSEDLSCVPAHLYSLVSLLHFQQFNAEIKFLACHLVIGIQRDMRVVLGCDSDRERLSVNAP